MKMSRNKKIAGKVKYPKEHLLFELYRMRGLTVKQIERAIIGSYDYAYEYMKKLEKDGYVSSTFYNSGTKRMGKHYTITDTGIEMLVSEGLIHSPHDPMKWENEKIIPAAPAISSPETKTNVQEQQYMPKHLTAYRNNQNYDKHKVIYTILTNELYAEITAYGMHFFDSREWKVRHGLNRNAIVRGGFKTLTGEEYSLYALFSTEQTKTAHISENMLRRIVEEINNFQQGGQHIIYVFDEEKYDWIVEYMSSLKMHSNNVHIIRHCAGEGYKKLRLLSDSEEMEQILSHLVNTSVKKIDHATLGSRYATHEFQLNDETYLLTNFLTNNIGSLVHLVREFTPERSSIEGKKLAIIAWEQDVAIMKAHFGHTEHIRVRLISDETMDELSYAKPQLLGSSVKWKVRSEEINRHRETLREEAAIYHVKRAQ